MNLFKKKEIVEKVISELLIVLLICFFGIVLRIVQFGEIPPGLNQDEAASGYEAYSLLLTGKDKWGNVWPTYFSAWGAGQNVLYSYLSIPVICFFGLNIISIRAINLLFGILTIPLFYIFVKRVINKRIAYITTLLIAISPWHIMLSRWGLESNLLPFFILFGFYSVSVALSPESSFSKISLSLVPWGVGLYAYGTFYFIIPIILILVFKEYKTEILKRKKSWFLAISFFLIISFPVIVFIFKNSVFRSKLFFEEYLPFSVPLLTSTPFRAMNPQTNLEFVVNGFQDNNIWNTIPGVPPIYMILFPFLCIGIFVLKNNRKFHPGSNLILIWFLSCFPLFFISSLNVNRANSIFIPSLIISLIGFEVVCKELQYSFIRNALQKVIITWVMIVNLLFLTNYFFFYSPKAYEAFNYGLDLAFNVAKKYSRPSEKILITNEIRLPYVYILFLDQYSPSQFQKYSHYSLDKDGIYNVTNFGRFYFDKESLNLNPNESYFFILKESENYTCKSPDVLYQKYNWRVGRCFE